MVTSIEQGHGLEDSGMVLATMPIACWVLHHRSQQRQRPQTRRQMCVSRGYIRVYLRPGIHHHLAPTRLSTKISSEYLLTKITLTLSHLSTTRHTTFTPWASQPSPQQPFWLSMLSWLVLRSTLVNVMAWMHLFGTIVRQLTLSPDLLLTIDGIR